MKYTGCGLGAGWVLVGCGFANLSYFIDFIGIIIIFQTGWMIVLPIFYDFKIETIGMGLPPLRLAQFSIITFETN